MKTIQIYDPAMCCSSGVCGVDIDEALVTFSADIAWAKEKGVQIERFDLSSNPMAFANNPAVSSYLELSGADALPLILVDGQVALAGRYPTRPELAKWAGNIQTPVKATTASSCCSGSKCC